MFDPDDCHTAITNAADQGDKLFGFLVRQAAGDFVKQQQRRPRSQRPGQFKPLAIQQRQRTGQRVRPGIQFAIAQDLRAIVVAVGLAPAAPNAAATSRFSNVVMAE